MSIATHARRADCDEDWADVAGQWDIRPDTIYLNHGSFGPSPRPVRERLGHWRRRMESQPMDHFVRDQEPAWRAAREVLAGFVGTVPGNLVFVDNATYAMNVIADSFPLHSGDEVLFNDHEYGAVRRILQRRCRKAGARLVEVQLPPRIESPDHVIDTLFSAASPRTRLMVVSHITSPTALIMPVAAIVARARQREIAVAVDGPHAPAQVPLDIDALGCDFYAASCHKWLAAPLGSGFLYAHPRWHARMEPAIMSWGRLLPAEPAPWDEEFIWSGTRDIGPFLAVPAAIEFLNRVGPTAFRQRTYWMARHIRARLESLFDTQSMAQPADEWYGTMAHVPLPPGDWGQLQDQLWRQDRIEVPVILHGGRWFVRVSNHLYTRREHVEFLEAGLRRLVGGAQ
jgi:isopenicillin-N epimerase